MQSKKPSNLYEQLGVDGPTSEAHGTPEDLSKQFEKARTKGHIWQQRGSFVVCTSCPFEHSFTMSPNKLLTGTDEDGMPVISDIKIS